MSLDSSGDDTSSQQRTDPDWCAELLASARLMLRSRHGPMGEDLAQDALVVALQAYRSGKLSTPDEARAFMYGTCKNLARAEARKQARRNQLLQRNTAMFEQEVRCTPALDRDHLWACLNLLTARNRDVVLKSFVEECDTQEIANELGVSAENVRVIRYRALVALKHCMEGDTP